ncbi:MAG: hypothetical protein U1A78_41440 [Polyangia bacterium]
MMSRRAALFAAVGLPWLLGPVRAQAGDTAAPRFEITKRAVSEAEFEAFRAKLKGQRSYHCKKTVFGGVVSYLAQDASGLWYLVTQVSGGTRPSTIEPAEAPKGE